MMRVPNDIDVNDPRVLDRLVDSELTDAEERAVIAQLSQSPDGWRRCALAMLEARCWQRAARHVRELSDPDQQFAPSRIDTSPLASRLSAKHVAARQRRSIRWPGALSLCALFLLAFGVGTFLPRPWNRSTVQHAEQPAPPVQLVDNGGPQVKESASSATQAQEVNSQDLLLGNLTLVDDSGHQFDVPVYDWNRQVAEQLMYRSQPLSPEFFQQLKRHQVRSHRSYLPVKLKDGRQVILPVQELEIVPVGGTAY